MASILRQIVAGPRARHPEAGLDLCYVTPNIVATSGPSQSYPKRAYRTPLDRLVSFLDSKHGEDWAIWEFRAEGTGYPDEAVYERIRHYPWPDHHPPPFRLIPLIMASMRNWLDGGSLDGSVTKPPPSLAASAEPNSVNPSRVVVVHCKAGKGRSGTIACSYLISNCGWSMSDALQRFTERRMRPGFGSGVSIPSQLRWVSYVDKWTRGGKQYIDRQVEITEVHVWGLRTGVKLEVCGYGDEGKRIVMFHRFRTSERIIVDDSAHHGGHIPSLHHHSDDGLGDSAVVQPKKAATTQESNAAAPGEIISSLDTSKTVCNDSSAGHDNGDIETSKAQASRGEVVNSGLDAMRLLKEQAEKGAVFEPSAKEEAAEPGGEAVIFKPSKPIRVTHSDVLVRLERRQRTRKAAGLTMVTALAHVWFNVFFEGGGPENIDGKADASGVFEIDWDAMDGLKGSKRKGVQALDRMAVVWKVVGETEMESDGEVKIQEGGEEIKGEEDDGSVPQMRPADWKEGEKGAAEHEQAGLGVKKTSDAELDTDAGETADDGDEVKADEDGDELEIDGVKSSGPMGEAELGEEEGTKPSKATINSDDTK